MGSSSLRILMSMRKDENFSLALDLKICNSLWASVIKLQDAFRFTMPDLFLNTRPVTSPKPESHSLLIVLPRTACARTQSYSTSSCKTQRCMLFFISVYFFFHGGGGESKRLGNFSFHGLPFSHQLKTRPSLRKTKPVTLAHDTTAILMYQTNHVGVELLSLTLSFVSIFSSIPEWLPQKHSFLKHNFVDFQLYFLLKRYTYN